MARRLSPKSIILGLLVLLLAAAAITAPLLIGRKADPGQWVAHGDELAASGQFAPASQQYALALNRSPNDVPLLLKQADTLGRILVSEDKSAQANIAQMRQLWAKVLSLEPGHQQAFEALMQLDLQLAQEAGDAAAWQDMLSRSQSALSAGGPALAAAAIRYHGIASVSVAANPAALAQGVADLRTALAHDPADHLASHYLSLALIVQARQQHAQAAAAATQPAGQVIELYQEALNLSRQQLAQDPRDPQRQIEHLKVLLNLGAWDALAPLAEKLATQLLTDEVFSNQPVGSELFLSLANLLTALEERSPGSSETAWAIAGQLLLVAGSKPGASLQVRFALAQNLRMTGQTKEAELHFQRIHDQSLQQPAVAALRSLELRRSAGVQYAELLIGRLAQIADLQVRQVQVKQAQTLLDQVAASGVNPGIVSYLRGRLAAAQGDHVHAATLLDTADQQLNHSNPQVLALAANSHLQMGDSAAAADRLERMLDLQPLNRLSRIQLAALRLQMRQLGKAQTQLDILLREQPNDPAALKLQAALATQMGQLDQAIAIYEKLDPARDGELLLPLAQLYQSAQQPDKARTLLESALIRQPQNLQILQQLVNLAASPEQAVAYIEQARKSGASPELLALLGGKTGSEIDPAQLLLKLAEREPDPVLRHLARMAVLVKFGRDDQAQEELAAAAKLNPDHAQVIAAQFEQALAQGDFAAAAGLAERAARLDLDSVRGLLYRGRLELARKQPAAALPLLRQAVALKPTLALAWQLLGQAQRDSGDLSSASASFAQALKLRPDNLAAVLALAGVQEAQGDRGAALASLRDASAKAPNNRLLLQQYLDYEERHGDANKALASRQQIARSALGDLENRRALALLQARLGQKDQALQTVDALLKEAPLERANAQLAAGVRQSLGQNQEAVAGVRQYLAARGAKADVHDHLLLARTLRGTGQLDDALVAYRQAAAVDDAATLPAARELADLLYDQQRTAEALPLYAKLMAGQANDANLAKRYGEALIRENQLDTAQKVLTQVVAGHGEDAVTHLLQAMLDQRHNRLDAALGHLDQAAGLAPRHAAVFLFRGQLLAGRDPAKAQADLNRALELDPNLAAARELLVQLHLQQRQFDAAIDELQNLLARQPNNALARRQLAQLYQQTQRAEQLEALLEQSLLVLPKDPYFPRLQAHLALAAGKTDRAIEKLSAAFAIDPAANALAELALLQLQTQRAEAALSLLQGNAPLVQDSPLLTAVLARVLTGNRREDQGLALFNKAAMLCQDYDSFDTVIDQAVATLNRLGAAQWLAQLKLDDQASKRLVPWRELAIARLEIESGSYAPALARLDKLADKDLPPAGREIWARNRLRGLSLGQLGKTAEALPVLRASLQAQQRDLAVLLTLAQLLAQDKAAAAEALTLAQQALQMAPQNSLVRDLVGYCQLQAGQVDAALTTLQAVTDQDPAPASLYHLALALQAKNRKDQARQIGQKAQALAQKMGDAKVAKDATELLQELGS